MRKESCVLSEDQNALGLRRFDTKIFTKTFPSSNFKGFDVIVTPGAAVLFSN